MEKLSVRDVDVRGKRVFVRVDFNVPLESVTVRDDTRIRAALPTIQLLRERRARLVLASHLGRPKGRWVPELSLRPVANRLQELLGAPVVFVEKVVGPEVERQVNALAPGEAALLENLRFHPGEEKNDPEFADQLAALADVYVNDAFGTAHRAHASTVGVPERVQPAAAGLLMEKELEFLGRVLRNPERPFYAILGGAKVSDKLGVIEKLLDVADAIFIGGAMAYTFLLAIGREVGSSLVEPDRIEDARRITIRAVQMGKPLYLPIDHVIRKQEGADVPPRTAWRATIPEGWEGVDIGPSTVEMFSEILRRARMIFWNGPLGVYEQKPFDQGTVAIARALADLDAITVIGGGDVVAAVHQAGVADRMTHISTGGGATLEFLEGKELPGVAALTDRS